MLVRDNPTLLDFDERHRRRMAMTGTRGLEFLLDLENAVALRGGDALVLEDFLLDRRGLPDGWAQRVAAWRPVAAAVDATGLRDALYSFV